MSVPSFTIAGLLALLTTLGFLASISSRFIRSRLRFSLWLLLAFLGLQVAVSQGIGDVALLRGAGAAGLRPGGDQPRHHADRQSLAKTTVRRSGSRRSCRTSSLIGLFTIVATVLMKEQLLTTSAVGAVVVGFALQDTLGNLFPASPSRSRSRFASATGSQWRARKGRCRRSRGGRPSFAPRRVSS